MNQQNRKAELSKVDREILTDLLKIVKLQMLRDTKKKYSKSQALSVLLKEFYQSKPEVLSQIDMVENKRITS
jgi:hypothetical protein